MQKEPHLVPSWLPVISSESIKNKITDKYRAMDFEIIKIHAKDPKKKKRKKENQTQRLGLLVCPSNVYI